MTPPDAEFSVKLGGTFLVTACTIKRSSFRSPTVIRNGTKVTKTAERTSYHYCHRQNYDLHSPLSYYLVRFNDLPFSLLLILLRLFIEITKEIMLMSIKSN